MPSNLARSASHQTNTPIPSQTAADTDIKTSELSAADPGYRLLFEIRSRKNAIIKQYDYYRNTPSLAPIAQAAQTDVINHKGYLNHLEALLVNSSLKNHTTYKEVRRSLNQLGSTSQHLGNLFPGINLDRKTHVPQDPALERYLEITLRGRDAARIALHRSRMIDEIETRVAQGWYIVFDSLSVANHHYKEVFHNGSRAWPNYIRSIHRRIGKHIYGTIREADRHRHVDPFHTYFAVVERGAKHGRLHIHVVHCFRDIPNEWKSDPNRGRSNPYYRLVGSTRRKNSLRCLWPYGHSYPIACRFGESDAFGRLGWRWPTQLVKGSNNYTACPRRPPGALASYMVKYLVKSFNQDKRKASYVWKTRISRQFGTIPIKNFMKQLETTQLRQLLTPNFPILRIGMRIIPRQFTRHHALKELLSRTRNAARKSSLIPGSSALMLLKSLMALKPQPSIVERWRSSIRTTLPCNLVNAGHSNPKPTSTAAVSEIMLVAHNIWKPKPRYIPIAGGIYAR
ncbi:replication initiator protein [Microviridae sp.]|nr:replication initiator protein [Microviridae sp.]